MVSAGQQIGGYTILQRIGVGTMGEVFLAKDAREGARVAIRVLAPELSQKPTVLGQFFKEARATSQIHHPGIAATLDCFVHQGQAFVAMELLRGESLATYLRRAGPIRQDLPFLLGLADATASAVGAVHAAGIIHRDLKPGSIYLHLAAPTDPGVTVKILDYGIGRLSQEQDGPGQTASEFLVGTPSYMSPEQCRGATGIDARSDIYTLGCILYEASCGRPPFLAEGMGDLLMAHLSQVPEPPAKLVTGLPPALNSLLVRMLAKKPVERPQTMGDVLRGLRDCARGLPIEIGDHPLQPKRGVQRPAPYVDDEVPPGLPVAWRSDPEGLQSPVSEKSSLASPPETKSGPAVMRQTTGPSTLPTTLQHTVETNVIGDAGGTLMYDLPASASAPMVNLSPYPPSSACIRADSLAANANGTLLLDLPSPPAPRLGRNTATTDDRRTSPKRSPALVSHAANVTTRRHRGLILASGVSLAVLIAIVSIVALSRSSPLPDRPPKTQVIGDSVEIEIRGLPPNANVTLDDHAVTLPIRLPRSIELHRIALRSSNAPTRTFEVDGTRDRIIELVAEGR
jgi:serine/threonine protein kinase